MTSRSLPQTDNDWHAFLAGFENVVLVANAPGVDPDVVSTLFPGNTLFCFFNRTFKVLTKPFERESLVFCALHRDRPSILKRKEMPQVEACFGSEALKGIAAVSIYPDIRANMDGFGNVPNTLLDLVDLAGVADYPGETPTTGFLITRWMLGLGLENVHIYGFNGQRSDRWRVYAGHNWTLEQIGLRTLANRGDIKMHAADGSEAGPNIHATLEHMFPDIPPSELHATALDVLNRRLTDTNSFVDRLWNMAYPQKWIAAGVRGLELWIKKLKGKA